MTSKTNEATSGKDSLSLDSLRDQFRNADAGFIGISKLEDDVYSYKATDLLVQNAWELPIVVQWPRSVIHYEFSSQPGDIAFGILFVPAPEEGEDLDDLAMETVEQMDLVPSSAEVVSGSFELPSEGVVFFMWDNSHDWISNKQISYKISVSEPSFTLYDQYRASNSLKQLREVVDDLEIAYSRRADAEDYGRNNTANVQFLEHQISEVTKKLEARREEYASLQTCIMDCYAVLHIGKEAMPGIQIRQLDRWVLGQVLSFLGGETARGVCRHWREVYDQCSSSDKRFSWHASLTKADVAKMRLEMKAVREAAQRKNLEIPTSEEPEPIQLDSTNAFSKKVVSSSDSDLEPMLSHTRRSRRFENRNTKKTNNDVDVEEKEKSFSGSLRMGADLIDVPKRPKERSHRNKRKEEKLVNSFKEIRSEQQQHAIMEYIHNSYAKIATLQVEKRRLKRLIRAWNASFEKQHGHLPSNEDRPGHLRELYEEYQQVSLALKIREDKVEKVLRQVDLPPEKLEELKNHKI